MVHCLNGIPADELAKLKEERDRDSLTLVIVKLASNHLKECKKKTRDLWPEPSEFNKVSALHYPEYLKKRLAIPTPLKRVQEVLTSAKTGIGYQKELVLRRATYILDVSLLNIELSHERPSLLAAAAYYAALSTISTDKNSAWVSGNLRTE